MTARRTLTISITPEQDALVKACLASGRFASASEVVRAALRLLERVEVVGEAPPASPSPPPIPDQVIRLTAAEPAITVAVVDAEGSTEAARA